jgi:hypothetical protein
MFQENLTSGMSMSFWDTTRSCEILYNMTRPASFLILVSKFDETASVVFLYFYSVEPT